MIRNRAVGAVVKGVRTLFDAGTSTGLSDGQLLERYLRRGDDSAEAAFRAWSSVMARWCSAPAGACCTTSTPPRMLFRPRSSSSRKRPGRSASGTRSRAGCSAWPIRVAGRADAQRRRRADRERQGVEMTEAGTGRRWIVGRDGRGGPGGGRSVAGAIPGAGRPVLPRGPDPGRSGDPAAAAGQHGPGAADAGAARLRDRLIRRGLGPGALRGPLGRSRRGGDTRSPRGRNRQGRGPDPGRPGGGASAPVAALAEGVIRAMFLAKLKTAAALLAALTCVSLGMIATLAGRHRRGKDRPPRRSRRPRKSRRARPRTGAPR